MKLRVKGLRTRLLPLLILVLGFLVAWEAGSWFLLEVMQTPLAQSKLPYIHKIFFTFGEYGEVIFVEGWITFTNAGLGFIAGTITGILLGIVMSASKWVEQITFPYAVASQMVPILGLAPIVYSIVRNEDVARVLISAYITFFPVALNMLRGLRSLPPSALDLMHSYAAKPVQVYWKLRFPAALPSLFSGLKIAAPLAITGAILVELMGAQRGVGVIMLKNLYYGPSHIYMFWTTVFTAALLGILSYALINLLERIVSPWQPEFRPKGGEG